MTTRRHVLRGVGAAWATLALGACSAERPSAQTRARFVAFLFTRINEPAVQTSIATVKRTLAELGYVDGQNITYDGRSAEGDAKRFDTLAAGVVALGPDVIVCQSPQAGLALIKATSTIPIVFVGTGTDVLDVGLVKDLARPDRNLTGFSGSGPSIGAKRLQLLKEIAPRITRVAVFQDQGEPSSEMRGIQNTAPILGVEIVPIYLGSGEDLEKALKAAADARVDALMQTTTTQFITGIVGGSARIAAFAIAQGWPTAGVAPDVGGLMNYNALIPEVWQRAARYVDRLLRGAKPADLPIEGPTTSGFTINVCTASKIGVTVPPSTISLATNVLSCPRP